MKFELPELPRMVTPGFYGDREMIDYGQACADSMLKHEQARNCGNCKDWYENHCEAGLIGIGTRSLKMKCNEHRYEREG